MKIGDQGGQGSPIHPSSPSTPSSHDLSIQSDGRAFLTERMAVRGGRRSVVGGWWLVGTFREWGIRRWVVHLWWSLVFHLVVTGGFAFQFLLSCTYTISTVLHEHSLPLLDCAYTISTVRYCTNTISPSSAQLEIWIIAFVHRTICSAPAVIGTPCRRRAKGGRLRGDNLNRRRL